MAFRRGFWVIGRGSLARLEVRFPQPGSGAVRTSFPGGGTGRPAQADVLDLALGMLAWGVHGTDEGAVRATADRIRAVATAIAGSPDGAIPPGTITVTTRTHGTVAVGLADWGDAPGGTVVAVDLVRAAVGVVPVRSGSPPAPSLVLGGLVACAWDAMGADAPGRLAIALALEGLIAWYTEAHRLTPARDAVASARMHAADRLRAAGHALPPALADVSD
jgi:hypothetical protein